LATNNKPRQKYRAFGIVRLIVIILPMLGTDFALFEAITENQEFDNQSQM